MKLWHGFNSTLNKHHNVWEGVVSTLSCRTKSPSMEGEVAEARAYTLVATSVGSSFSSHLFLLCDSEPVTQPLWSSASEEYNGVKLYRRSWRDSQSRWHLRRDLKNEKAGHARRRNRTCKGDLEPVE